MALNGLEFFHWLTTSAERHGITFTTRDWLNPPPQFPKKIVYAHGSYNGREYFGIGHAVSPREAHVIAAAELLERIAMAHARYTNSNGCAVHTDSALARESAKAELLERDSFLCHFYTGTPCAPLPPELRERFDEIRQYVGALGRDFSAGLLLNEEGRPCVIAGMNGFGLSPAEGIFLGLGTAATFRHAFEKAIAECLRFLDVHLEKKTEPLGLEEFLRMKGKGVREHIRLAFDAAFGKRAWNKLFPPAPAVSLKERRIEYVFEEFPLSGIFPDCPLHFVRATSSSLVMVEFGDRWEESLQPERLKRFRPESAHEPIPHPLG